MDKPSPKERVQHIKSAILKIKSLVLEKSRNEFTEDLLRQDAVMYQFIIIGEAIRHIDRSILDKYPYPWHILRSFRNYIAHEYHKISMESVYNAANDLDKLLNVINLILINEFPD
jgi:uncharacterized protein with HEPN domain